jgi:hypothetical protein
MEEFSFNPTIVYGDDWIKPFVRTNSNNPYPKYRELKYKQEGELIEIKYAGNIVTTTFPEVLRLKAIDKKHRREAMRPITQGHHNKFTALNGFIYGLENGIIKVPVLCPDTDSERFNVEGVV